MIQIKQSTPRVNKISIMREQIAKVMSAFEIYSYQCNIKIVGMLTITEPETLDQTSELCLKFFSALGVQNVSVSDINTAHQVPSRSASDRANAIVCKFVRQLAKE